MGELLLSDAAAAQEAGLDEARSSVPLYDETNINVIDTGDGEAPGYNDNVDAIEAWITTHPADAQRFLDAEEAKSKPRASLVDSLTAVINASDPQE